MLLEACGGIKGEGKRVEGRGRVKGEGKWVEGRGRGRRAGMGREGEGREPEGRVEGKTDPFHPIPTLIYQKYQ